MPARKGSRPWNKGISKGWVDKRGYRWIYVSENGVRRAKREHRHIMEMFLGRKLEPEELIHHKNGDTSDNRLENLELIPWGKHTSKHHFGLRHPEYTKETQSVVAEYRENVRRLTNLNSELLEALEEALVSVEYERDHQFLARKTNVLDDFIQQTKQLIAKAKGETE